MRVKICGVTNVPDALAASRAGADYVGLIRAPGPRQVTLAAAGQIVAALPRSVTPVLLFRDAPLDEVCAALENMPVGCVQLHGCERIDYLTALATAEPRVRLIRAWNVAGPHAWDDLPAYLTAAAQAGIDFEAIILDTPKTGPHPGFACLGDVARRCRGLAARIFCAGGLTPENVSAALSTGPFDGADVSRGVETRPGVKDHAAIAEFIQRARATPRPQ